jgi:hypothetical protein
MHPQIPQLAFTADASLLSIQCKPGFISTVHSGNNFFFTIIFPKQALSRLLK